MAINIRCQKCSADMKLNSKKCSRCGTPVPKNRKYRVIVRVNGKRMTKTVNNLELARDLEGKMKVDHVRGEFNIKKKKKAPTLDEFWKKYQPWLKEHKASWRTDAYYYKKHLKPEFGNKQLDSISPFDIERFVLKMKKTKSKRGRPYAQATIRHQLVLLTRLYSVASKWGQYSEENPCKKVAKPKLNNQVTEYLTDEELRRLIDVLNNWPDKMSAGFVFFLLYTGLRRGELFKLTWGDVDLARQTITLKDPKGKLDQTLPISDKAADIITNLPKKFETKWIFHGKNGKQRTDFKGPWLRIKKAAGLQKSFRLHGLRHHFASSLVSAGVDLYTVQKLLTHKDASMTMRYAHLADQALRDAVNLSDKLQNGEKPIMTLEERRNA